MIKSFLFLLLISCAFCQINYEKECKKDEECLLLKKEITDRINPMISPCTDTHALMCRQSDRYLNQHSLENRLTEMKVYFFDTLSTPTKEDDYDLLKVEKKLYQSCMQLDKSGSRSGSHFEHLKSQLYNLGSLGKWQDVENKLFSLGFGYSFFDIKVIAHPKHESRNTILLQPPPLDKLRSLNDIVKKVLHYRQQYRDNQYSSDAKAIHDLYNFINVNDEKKVEEFVSTLQEAKLGLLAQSTDFPEHYTTLKQLKNMKIHSYFEDIPVEISWVEIIQHLLRSKAVEFNVDNIILKNPRYFLHLTKLLHDTANDIIVSAIQTRAVSDNLPYMDWDRSNSLENINKRLFCMKETKLYGASRKLVQDWMTTIIDEDDDRHSSFRKSESIFTNVMATILDEIAAYNSKSPSTVTYYKRKLYSVVDNLNKYVYEAPYNIYSELDVSSQNHWKNILEYRKMLASIELNNLHDRYDTSRPFSFIDQDEPQNRFVISTLINVIDMRSSNLPKEVHYGRFGVRTAALMHSLLHEDTYNDDDVTSFISKKFIRPKYPESVEFCIRDKMEMDNSADHIDDTITHVLALNTAYKALLHDRHVSFHGIVNTYLSHLGINSHRLFFIAYVEDNCAEYNIDINKILSHNYLFDKVFECKNNVRINDWTCSLGKLDS